MILKSVICLFKGHDINPDESIIKDTIKDKRDWLCKCHRCGLYEMHDGAISGETLMITERQAMRVKMEIERDMAEFDRRIGRAEQEEQNDTLD